MPKGKPYIQPAQKNDWETPPEAWPWSEVQPQPDGCWPVRKTRKSYAILRVNGHPQAAHRVAFELAFGPIPSNALVLHRCDNPPCIRPTHLFLGSQRDNILDAIQKGRLQVTPPPPGSTKHPHRPLGESNGNSRLVQKDVQSIREAYSLGATVSHLAREFGVDRGNIRCIIQRKTWQHIT